MRPLLAMTTAVFCTISAPIAAVHGHGLPIDLIVIDDAQISPFSDNAGVPLFGAGELVNTGGLISSSTPGIGVTNAANGLAADTELFFEVTTGLMYWDGNVVTPTVAELSVFAPNFQTIYRVDSSSVHQSGMQWGTYTGERFWEEDGLYTLKPASAGTGVYGFGIRITSPTYLGTEEFLLPFVYGNFAPDAQTLGFNALRNAIASPLAGDFDGNGKLEAEDIDLLVQELASDTPNPSFDLNQDEAVDLEDHRFWVESIKRTYFGDANLDGEFTSSDLIQVFQAAEYEDLIPKNSTWTTGDWTGDLEFNSTDIIAAFQGGGYEIGPQSIVPTVPEPNLSRLALLLGFVMLRSGSVFRSTIRRTPVRNHP